MSSFHGSFPVRVSVTTLNVWGNKHWPARGIPLVQTLLTLRSDVYLFQEVTPSIISYLDSNLATYSRVEGPRGWTTESNIYWNSQLFDLVDSGRGDLALDSYPDRSLFWARLRIKGTDMTIFVSTAHFPWAGDDREVATGINARIPAAMKVCEHLRRLVPPGEPTIFGGDVNDDFHPVRVLNEEGGLMDVFESLDLPPPITHPVRPSDPQEEMRPNR
ncbi:Endonuclease/exonuclease/phosphatase [Ochromonadaceae sp. CCMP2298]|nr:Endonuclease/exonuclease/phosphatase [Ochromonadaceae sp. CCMP2298]